MRRKYKPRGELHSWRVTYDEDEGGPSVVVTASTEAAARRAARRDPAMASWRIGKTVVVDLGLAVLEDRRIVFRSLKLTESEAAEQDALAEQRQQDWSKFARDALDLAVASGSTR